MKNLKYLNGVLTVIAACLVILTLSVIGVFPKAMASSSTRVATVPVNPDGSINVKLLPGSNMVDIEMVGGQPVVKLGDVYNTKYAVPIYTQR